MAQNQARMKTFPIKAIAMGVLLIALYGCNHAKIPTPAISFHEDLTDIYKKETNKLVEQHFAIKEQSPDAISYQQQWIRLKYSTDLNDTIEYFFIKNHLFSVSINSPKFTYENTIKGFDTVPQCIKINNNHYKLNDYYIHIGKRNDNGVYLLYFNDKNDEITRMFQANEEFNQTEKSSEQICAQTLLYLMGRAAGDQMLPEHMQEHYKYYMNIFK